MPTVFGNTSSPFANNPRALGAGAVNERNSIGHVEVHGNAGDVFIFGDDEVKPLPQSDSNMLFQVQGADVTVVFTLANLALAKNRHPDVQANVPWVHSTVITAGTIVESPVRNFSAVRVTFSGTGTLFILGR